MWVFWQIGTWVNDSIFFDASITAAIADSGDFTCDGRGNLAGQSNSKVEFEGSNRSHDN